MKAVDAELDALILNDVIEEIKTPSKWISAIVAVPKEKKPGQVQITVDSRLANKAIVRIKYVSPTTAEIADDMNGAVYITRFDGNKGYH